MVSDMRAVLEPAGLRRYDELNDAQGGMREHWRPLIERLRADGSPDAVRRSLELTRRLIVENGVTYNVYADPQGADRPWALDPLPFVIPDAEWRAIEAGVAQRARLLNALLADLYGPQRLIAEGHVPAELAFGHPNYLWPCQGLQPLDGNWLHVYAADLARAPDGRWWLLADRTQAPSGAGYALENREILEQVHPEAIAEIPVRRVRGFFGGLRASLLNVGGDEAPLAVILTPGPYNETYFEHAFLARQLGMPLVEGHDLTVRGNTVFLKTLGGLRRVHSILRRLDDDFCDPLELRSDSALGVPGLLGALRAKRVMVANALGTGVIESAAWLGFLPPIAERLIGERLLLPEVATWWLGERPALEYVLANLDRLVIKPAYPNQRFEPMFGRDFQGAERDELIARLRNRPYAYVAQEHVQLSLAPVWKPSVPQSAARAELGSRALTIRVYAVVTPGGIRVMPGGLARVANEQAAEVVSTQRGGGAKDIWVLGPAEDSNGAAPNPDPPPGRWSSQARQDYIPSRLVENLYWLGRYTVRAENTARLLLRTLAARPDARVWTHARQICRDLGAIGPDADVFDALRAPESQGLHADVKHLAWSASQVRNRLSARYWRGVVGLQRQMQEAAVTRGSSREVYERLLLSLAALTGFSEEDMIHDEGWRVMRLGRRIERMQFVAGILERQLSSPHALRAETVEWLLEVCDSTPVYRMRYAGQPRLSQMLNLLLYDDGHPMALAFHRRSIERDLDDLARSLGEREPGVAVMPLLPAGTPELLDAAGEPGNEARAGLAQELRALTASAGDLSDRLSRRYFAHIESDAQALAT
jgi:uncharacterized circularly permuted ATP-grasp superfamily protein/uncharacterized alpha-E superfamily protein